jgi:hypothetical protein
MRFRQCVLLTKPKHCFDASIVEGFDNAICNYLAMHSNLSIPYDMHPTAHLGLVPECEDLNPTAQIARNNDDGALANGLRAGRRQLRVGRHMIAEGSLLVTKARS